MVACGRCWRCMKAMTYEEYLEIKEKKSVERRLSNNDKRELLRVGSGCSTQSSGPRAPPRPNSHAQGPAHTTNSTGQGGNVHSPRSYYDSDGNAPNRLVPPLPPRKGVSPTDTPRGSGGSNSIGGNSGGENNKGGNGNGMNNQPAPGSKYSYNSNGIGKKLNSGQINILTKRISANNNNISPNGSVKAVKAPKVSDLDSTKRTGEEELVIPENYSPVPSQRFEEVYKRGDILGSGAFGTVNKCTRISDPSQTFAVKIIERKKFKLRPMVQIALQREVAVMKMCSHPGVLEYKDFFDDDLAMYIVMEFVDGDDLSGYMAHFSSSGRGLSESLCIEIYKPLLDAISYLHDRDIAHRDIKPANILLGLKKPDYELLYVKVADFGFAKLRTDDNQFKTQIGTPAYTAPEIRRVGHEYSVKVDLWALGVMLYEMIAGAQPFPQFEPQVVAFEAPHWTSKSEEVKDLIKNLLLIDPEQRFCVRQALNHPWLQS